MNAPWAFSMFTIVVVVMVMGTGMVIFIALIVAVHARLSVRVDANTAWLPPRGCCGTKRDARCFDAAPVHADHVCVRLSLSLSRSLSRSLSLSLSLSLWVCVCVCVCVSACLRAPLRLDVCALGAPFAACTGGRSHLHLSRSAATTRWAGSGRKCRPIRASTFRVSFSFLVSLLFADVLPSRAHW